MHYFLPKELIVYTDNHALKFINKQHKLNQRHAKWVEYIQIFNFLLKHKSVQTNKVADAISRRSLLFQEIQANSVGFDSLKDLYEHDDVYFKEKFQALNSPISRYREP